MTPKEKANKLCMRFLIQTTTDIPYGINKVIAKQCALIAVDEMIIQNGELYLNGLDGIYYRKKNNYLFELKTEIEKL